MQPVKIGIIGGAGYTGGELIRILLHHPAAEILFVQSKSNTGNHISKVHTDLYGETNMIFSDEHHFNIDLLFFCSGHGEARKFISENEIPANIKLIDIGNDFRLTQNSFMGNRKFVYGLPELNRKIIKSADNIANPGCFATAIQLGLLPLAKSGMIADVYTTGITGATGAGQSLSDTSHFSWRLNNIQAYKTFTHQHLGEINESLAPLQDGKKIDIRFVPWRGDFARGIFTSSQFNSDKDIELVNDLYTHFYHGHPFIFISKEAIHLKQVINTNKCFIQIEKTRNNMVVHTIIDNLLKGASGQAVQNMNLMFGFEETLGLKLKANYF